MKAGVSSPNGLELRDIPQPVPKPNEVLVRVKACGLNRADLSAARASLGHGMMGAALGLEWAGEVVERRRRREGLQAGRPRGVLGQRRLCRIRRVGLRPHASAAGGLQLRAGRGAAGRAAHAAQRAGHARPPQGGRERADPGRKLRRRPDGPADRQDEGRKARDGLGDQRCAPRAAEGIRRRPRDRHARREMARSGAGGDRRQGREPDRRHGVRPGREPDHEGDGGARPHRQCRAARRRRRPSSTSTCMP